MPIVLATTHHDPDNRLYPQLERLLPRLREFYPQVVVVATPVTPSHSLGLLEQHGATIVLSNDNAPPGLYGLGQQRRLAVESALRQAPDCSHAHLCDLDRVLHWIEYYPNELNTVLAEAQQHPFTVLGRTPRAFDSHPRVQRDTENIINHTFLLASRLALDVTAGTRIFERTTAHQLFAHCADDTVGVDCSWPLVAQQLDIAIHYCATEGLEFETLDRYGDEVAALGSAVAWLDRLDSDPQQWATRLLVAHIEVDSVTKYGKRER